ncbi:stage II sporulation protein R [Paenibacillus filicis]|uniref:Stage II sporulation protein R n=1 Tax=Paenibacillus filicis TaxID=669464 RepID=A0ABU9DW41_9BACL
MVKRWGWKRYAYLGFALLMLLMSWESSRANAMLFTGAASGGTSGSVIPAESIRLRILANSDSASDQWIKREVRDAVIEQMNGWVTEPDGIEAARAIVRSHLGELEATVGETLRQGGFDYTYTVELGTVPFPTKMYGNQVYPAGDYEALRISIGAAEGQNWWCVLFPPLCFVDSEMVVKKDNKAHAASLDAEEVSADLAKSGPKDKQQAADGSKTAVSNGKAPKTEGPAAKKQASAGADQAGKEKAAAGKEAAPGKATKGEAVAVSSDTGKAEKPEVRFFLWDLITKVVSWFV